MADRNPNRAPEGKLEQNSETPIDQSDPGDTPAEDGVEVGWKGGVAGTTANSNQWGESLANERFTAGRTSGISSVEDA